MAVPATSQAVHVSDVTYLNNAVIITQYSSEAPLIPRAKNNALEMHCFDKLK
jgi:hypothetical protein